MITIRPADPADIEALILLLTELFQIEVDFQVNPAKQRAGLELLLNSDNGRIFVAQTNDSHQVVAICSVQILISTAEGAKVGMVEDLIVSAAYRGQGIGQKLLRHLENWAQQQGLKRLQLLADKNNQPALDFYARQDWQATQLIALRKR
jgi:ribosomal protein S18 acetylase RimI-like enzyme